MSRLDVDTERAVAKGGESLRGVGHQNGFHAEVSHQFQRRLVKRRTIEVVPHFLAARTQFTLDVWWRGRAT